METGKMSQEQISQRENKNDELKRWLEEIDDVLLASDTEQNELISQRVVELASSDAGEIGYVGRRTYDGFIGPSMGIRRSLFVAPVYLDDPSIYKDLLDVFATYKKTIEPDKFNIGSLIPYAVQGALTKFFGNAVSTKNTEPRNREYLMERSVIDVNAEEDVHISISEYRDKRMGVCAEKSAVAQNMFKFMGIDSVVLVGSMQTEKSHDSHHGYQIVRYKDRAFLFDASNPKMKLDADGTLKEYTPAMYPITEQQAQDLQNGESVTVKSSSTRLDESGEVIEIDPSRTYNGPTRR